MLETHLLHLLAALGIGLLIGVERERRRKEEPIGSAAGIRTFTIAALAGAVAYMVGGVIMVAVATAGVALLAGVAFWRSPEKNPGLTTEVALVITVLIAALAMKDPVAAAAVGVSVAVLLAARTPIHHFVTTVLREEEVRGGLILAAATLVVLPLLPNEPMGPFGALNPHSIWRLVVLVLAIGAAGHIAVRALGARFGLPVAGLASGFVSSSATIGAMGARAIKTPAIMAAAVAAAVLSTVATVVQMAVVLGATSAPTLMALAVPLAGAGVVAVAYGVIFTLKALRQTPEGAEDTGDAFSIKVALIFAATLAVVMLGSAALREWFGEAGIVAAAALAGFVDTHAAAISVASLVASGKMTAAEALWPILAAFSTNTVTKIVLATTAGGRAFALRVVPGLILVAAAAWAGVVAPLFLAVG